MALAQCNSTVDSRGRELIQHGSVAFPIACYHDDFGKMNVPWHWHEELELAVLTEGSAVIASGNEKYVLRAGEGFFVNSGVLHAARDHAQSHCRFHSLCFHPRLVGGSLDSVFYRDYVTPLCRNKSLESLMLRPTLPWQQQILEATEQVWQLCVSESPGYEFRTRALLSEIVAALVARMPATQAVTGGKAARDAQRLKAMLAYIHDHYAGDLTARSIAASAAISESEALRCFRGTIGTSPIQYVKQYRIQQAAQQILETSDRISDIAVRCGFQDMSYFTKSFREETGCTPTEYRTQQK